MEEVRLPSTRAAQATPSAPQGFTGVLIAAPGVVPSRGRMIVSGLYVLPEQEAARIDERLHRALVSVVTVGEAFSVSNPFRGVLLFDDDEERSAWGRRGYFQFDALPERRELFPGDYYITVSLGRWLSNVVRVLVR
ncbi:uncharacterized protein SOCE26_048780 [Sorangium cellulosum]|uniref:Uncharacterized protein n=1 Tax=Sorangium cellulosum TaxID=56 RepID=A0A2L0EVV0_SORCE|nr:hypothetical protein [Sorangium cellulosum]AUX43430.1 uncharacterized protein SOCE26_048780 [Sorangium cellulosum]